MTCKFMQGEDGVIARVVGVVDVVGGLEEVHVRGDAALRSVPRKVGQQLAGAVAALSRQHKSPRA